MLENKGEEAWKIHKQIEERETIRRALLLKNAEAIHDMHSKGYYKVILGDDEAPWSAYLSQHELFYKASKVYQLDKIYLKFVKELGLKLEDIQDIPVSKLYNMIGVISKENFEDWIVKARELTSQDFNDELRKATGKESYLDCKHKFNDYEICSSCGFRHKK